MSLNEFAATNLRDTLLVRPSVESGPVNLARVLALEEKGLGLAVLEAEDLAVTTDVELALFMPSANVRPIVVFHPRPPCVRWVAVAIAAFRHRGASGVTWRGNITHLARVDLLTAEGIVVGTHVGGVGVIPVVSRGLSSVANSILQLRVETCGRAKPGRASLLARLRGGWCVPHPFTTTPCDATSTRSIAGNFLHLGREFPSSDYSRVVPTPAAASNLETAHSEC
jgi:hypothetical protein